MKEVRLSKCRSRLFGLLALLMIIGPCFAKVLCNENERTVFSFDTKSRKSLSICKHKNNDYLVYRYGTTGKIELQYPGALDKTSWTAFTFSGMRRAGGKANAGFGDYDLSFSIKKFNYFVFQTWSDEDGAYAIGVVVRNDKNKSGTRIDGLRETQKGSLVLLEEDSSYIENTAM